MHDNKMASILKQINERRVKAADGVPPADNSALLEEFVRFRHSLERFAESVQTNDAVINRLLEKVEQLRRYLAASSQPQ